MLTLLRLLLFARIIFSVLMAPTVASFGITVVVPFHCRTGAKCRPRRILSNGNDGGDGYILQLQLAMASSTRYGPRDGMIPPSSSSNDVNERSRLKSEFIQLLNTIIDGNKPVDEYPSLFTQNMDTIMKVIGDSNVGGGKSMLEEIMNEESQQSSETNDITTTTTDTTGNRVDQITDAVELILIFVESFVEQTKSMDDIYKQLLGKIFQSIAPSGANNMSGGETTPTATSISSLSTSSSSVGNMENQLDNLLSSEKAAFTPGFLRHVEGECIRISSLSTISPDSVKMLQILRLIQTRVLEELGKVSYVFRMRSGRQYLQQV